MSLIKINNQKDLGRIRRIALSSQGLHKAKAFGQGSTGVINAINHIGYVQIDTISVVERAHNHVLYSRVPNFKPSMINDLLLNHEIFEYWSHAAAFLPIEDYRFSLPNKQAIKGGQVHWYKTPDRKLMREMLARIRSEGALRSRDIETKRSKSNGWWDLKPAKKALEQLFMEGDLMVSQREGFQKVYDLTERVLPSTINTVLPTTEEFARHLVDQQLRCHGLVSLKGFTYLRKNTELRKAVKVLIENRLNEGEFEKIVVNDSDEFILRAGDMDKPLARLNKRLLILSPFDNSVIQRERLKSLFNFDYQIECYVPEPKRQYGYFSLPLLYGDAFIGRMDCKAHRKTKRLEIKFLHFENHDSDEDLVISAFTDAIEKFLVFQGCETVTVSQIHPKRLTKRYREALLQRVDIGDCK